MTFRLLLLLLSAACFAEPAASQPIVVEFDRPETAGISGFRAHWDSPIPLSEDGVVKFTDAVVKDRSPTAIWSREQRRGQPGALAFDALNRSLLVRFPGAMAQVTDRINNGYSVSKIELILPYRDTEL